MLVSRHAASFVLVATATIVNATGADGDRVLGDLGEVGTVEFPNSCSVDVKADMNRAVALLHSFFYDEARRVFSEAAAKDPKCAMAHWGVAMTLYHPLWAPPDNEALAQGAAAVARAKAARKVTDRERDYIAAIDTYYSSDNAGAAPGAPSCHGASPSYQGRAAAFEKAMAKLQSAYPTDDEAAIFHALTLLAVAPPSDPAFRNQKRAAAILEPLFKKHPNHPGIAHYLIHAYDFPPLAEKGLAAAKAYSGIAPFVPHALHMPSHIFTRLGMWKESVDANLRSAAASRAYADKFFAGSTYAEELHALDYAEYAYLQLGQDQKAEEIVARVAAVTKIFPEGEAIAAYALSTVPARYAIERQQWAEAAALPSRPTEFFSAVPFVEANLVFAKALGAARSGKVDAAEEGVERLHALRDSTDKNKVGYWASSIEWQRLAAAAWVARAKGRTGEGVKLMRRAAEMDDALGKSPISPGAIVPARELLGDMLLDLGKANDALTEYETSLRNNPHRLNSLLGAGRAAEQSGRADRARTYFEQAVALTHDGSGNARPQVVAARTFLAAR
jgi:tetratricopeptide (TPR) repeat protein